MSYLKNGIKMLFAALLLITTACASTGGAAYPEGSLEAQINEISGVRVTGTGDYARVVIQARKLSGARQGQSFSGKTDDGYRDSYKRPPLFVIDGQRVGRDFKEVKNIIGKKKVESVKLLSHSMASQYGSEDSQYGVIEITTKSK